MSSLVEYKTRILDDYVTAPILHKQWCEWGVNVKYDSTLVYDEYSYTIILYI